VSDSEDEIPAVARPKPEETGFDLEAALSSVVGLRVEVPADAFTAESLGTERLKPLREALPRHITYRMIRFVVADLQRAAGLGPSEEE